VRFELDDIPARATRMIVPQARQNFVVHFSEEQCEDASGCLPTAKAAVIACEYASYERARHSPRNRSDGCAFGSCGFLDFGRGESFSIQHPLGDVDDVLSDQGLSHRITQLTIRFLGRIVDAFEQSSVPVVPSAHMRVGRCSIQHHTRARKMRP